MPFTVVEEIDAQEATIVSFCQAATEEALVAAAGWQRQPVWHHLQRRREQQGNDLSV